MSRWGLGQTRKGHRAASVLCGETSKACPLQKHFNSFSILSRPCLALNNLFQSLFTTDRPQIPTSNRPSLSLNHEPHQPTNPLSTKSTHPNWRLSTSYRPSSSSTLMLSADDLYKLAIFLGSLAMLLIVLYHFLEVNAKDDLPDVTAGAEKKDGNAKAAARQGPGKS